jgi:hypothetical protein
MKYKYYTVTYVCSKCKKPIEVLISLKDQIRVYITLSRSKLVRVTNAIIYTSGLSNGQKFQFYQAGFFVVYWRINVGYAFKAKVRDFPSSEKKERV